MIKNPWEDMPLGSKRRASIPHDIFWIKEEVRGEYGLKISLKQIDASILKIEEIKFRNIEFLKAPRNQDEIEWYLLLKETEEWELFLKLCNDLIEQVEHVKKEETALNVIVNRLKRWQKLLMNRADNQLSLEVQMGLFTELYTLLYHVSKYTSIKDAVHSWGGPELDIQDFIFGERVLEVKSHKAARGEFITISSPYQLYSVKKSFNLIVYALSTNERGQTIADLINLIKIELEKEMLVNEMDLLDLKTAQYGYFDLIHKDNLLNFHIDRVSAYEVNDTFPKIKIEDVPEGILNLKYQVDLTKCEEYKVDIESLFEGGG